MVNPIEAVLFDLDGTLIDTAPDFIRIIKLMCQNKGYDCPSDAAIREQVSAGAQAMVRLIFQKKPQVLNDDEQILAYRQEFLDLYEADICVDSKLFEGFDGLLNTLEKQNITWGIVTNKPRYLAESLLDKLALSMRCSVLVCPDDVKKTKPDPEPLLLACQKLNVNPRSVIYVGDHIRDIQAGNAAQMTTMVAKFGYLSADDKANLADWQADVIVETPKHLIDYILNIITVR